MKSYILLIFKNSKTGEKLFSNRENFRVFGFVTYFYKNWKKLVQSGRNFPECGYISQFDRSTNLKVEDCWIFHEMLGGFCHILVADMIYFFSFFSRIPLNLLNIYFRFCQIALFIDLVKSSLLLVETSLLTIALSLVGKGTKSYFFLFWVLDYLHCLL